jgi:hypothetical protein
MPYVGTTRSATGSKSIIGKSENSYLGKGFDI